MADKFFRGVQLPDLSSGQGSLPEAGFLRVYARQGRAYGLTAAGNEVALGNVVHSAGNEMPTAADFPDRQTIIVKGLPARIYLLDDAQNVREIYNEDQANYLYWKSDPTRPAGRQTVSSTAPANPLEGDIWFRIE